MIMTIYLFLLIAMLICLGLRNRFFNEYSQIEDDKKFQRISPRYSETDEKRVCQICKIFDIISKILIIAFYAYNIYILRIKYSEITSMLAISALIVIPCLIILYITINKEFNKYFEIVKGIFEIIIAIIIIIGIVIYIICLVLILGFGDDMFEVDGTEKRYKEYSYSIEIVEMEEVPYTNISGGRYYIRSAPSIAYYYEVITANGNQTTKILDGYKYYVEKDEDNEYINNPHIKVYEIVREYTNLFGEEKKNVISYEYTICVPQNSIYYEQ